MSSKPEFQTALLAWYDAHKRDLPWRQTRDPYAIWVSEAMAQQTAVAVAAPYWLRWIERFPDIKSLAEADEQVVLSHWQGLGYYRRARSLLAAAREMVGSGIPQTYEGWLGVAGVGPYTAAAVSSIAFNHPVAVVDGNVERVFARLTNDESIGGELKRRATTWADAQLDRERPGDWNQALMELGALVCVPRTPLCSECPVSSWCKGLQHSTCKNLPNKAPKKQPVELTWTCRLYSRGGLWAVEKIEAGKWWEGMWKFPTEPGVPGSHEKVLGSIRHTVTHHKITLHVVADEATESGGQWKWVAPDEVQALPLPALYRKAWDLSRAPTLFEDRASAANPG